MGRLGVLYKVKVLEIIIIFITFICFTATLILNGVYFYNSK